MNHQGSVGIMGVTLPGMFFRVCRECDKIAQDDYDVKWHPGQENLADYQSKHHLGSHHTAFRPW
jgi:hypothetical protein